MKKHLMAGAAVLALLAGGYWAFSAGEASRPAGDHAHEDDHAHGDEHGHDEHGHGEGGAIRLTEAQIGNARIEVMEAGPGQVATEVRVTGTIVPDADRMAHIVTKLAGIVMEVPKRLGEAVAAGEVLAVLESRELAEAKGEYLAALREEQTAQTKAKREADLFRKRISAEQDYLDARTAADTARIRLDTARQRLAALGIAREDLSRLGGQDGGALGRLEVRSPIAGRVIARDATRGELLAAEKEIFAVADLSTVWVELPVYGADLAAVREGNAVVVTGAQGQEATGKLVFVAPGVDPATGAARAVAVLDNAQGGWRPGDVVTGAIVTGEEPADIVVPETALQTLEGETVVFARTDEGFERRVVQVGRRNGRVAEIVFGLFPGDRVAGTNTFVLKAEASKAEAEHSHSH